MRVSYQYLLAHSSQFPISYVVDDPSSLYVVMSWNPSCLTFRVFHILNSFGDLFMIRRALELAAKSDLRAYTHLISISVSIWSSNCLSSSE